LLGRYLIHGPSSADVAPAPEEDEDEDDDDEWEE
jgi:hypothetical protein